MFRILVTLIAFLVIYIIGSGCKEFFRSVYPTYRFPSLNLAIVPRSAISAFA